MNKKIYASVIRSTALFGAFAMLSLTTMGCVFTQSFGPNKTLIQNGEAEQVFSPCESGTLEYVSVYMQSTDNATFGAHLNIYDHSGDSPRLIHQQQLVVPSSAQNPYAKVWLTHNVEVELSATYSMEVIVPEGRSAEFFMAPEVSQKGSFTANDEHVQGSLAFEYGINPSGWSAEDRMMDELLAFEPTLAVYHGCAASQAWYNGWAEYSAGTLTQTVDACVLSDAANLYFNAKVIQGADMGLIFSIDDVGGNTVFTKLLSPSTQDYLEVNLEGTVFNLNETYTLNFKVLEGQVLECAVVDINQYFVGMTTFDGDQQGLSACFIVTFNEIEDSDDTTDESGDEGEDDEDDDDEVDPDDAWWNPLHQRPRRDGESLFYKAYPNPFSTQFSLTFEDAPVGKATVAVYSFTGVKVYETEIEDLSLIQKLDVIPQGELSKGYYTIRIEQGDSIILDTIIKH